MNKESGENEIDEIFRQAIEPVDTEPSDTFWRKAAENVIARESKLNKKRASRWRAVAFILGASLLLLGFFAYRLDTETGINTQHEKSITSTNSSPSNEKTGDVVNPDRVTANSNLNKTISDLNVKKSAKVIYNKSEAFSLNQPSPKEISVKNSANAYVTANKKKSGNQKSDNESTMPAAIGVNDMQVSEPKDNPSQENNLIPTDLNQTKKTQPDQKPEEKNNPNGERVVSVENKATTPTAPYLLKDTLKPNHKQEDSKDSGTSRFSLSAFFAPDYMLGYTYEYSNSWGSREENSIKTGEKQKFSYTAGAKLEYQLSSRFSISAGIAYQAFSFNISPQVIYAEKQSGGEAGYYITTSSGMVECPYYYGTPQVGDSMKINATSTRTYLEIPLQLKYCILNYNKFKFYFASGIETNICLGEKTTMNWHDFWNDYGEAIVTNTIGEEKVFFSYTLAIGADIKISKAISLFVEPELHEALTSLDNNTSVITYQRLFSGNAGITYHL